MKFDPAKHHRHSIRIPGYDYSLEGAYYVTIVVQGRQHLLGEITNDKMQLSPYGQIVRRAWFDLPAHYPQIELDAFVIMPNHVHGIIHIKEDRRGGSVQESERLQDLPAAAQGRIAIPTKTRPGNEEGGSRLEQNGLQILLPEGAGTRAKPSKTRPYIQQSLSEIVRAFKSFSARRINLLRRRTGLPVWQRNYYEHVIRDNADYLSKRDYILNNPRTWETDEER